MRISSKCEEIYRFLILSTIFVSLVCFFRISYCYMLYALIVRNSFWVGLRSVAYWGLGFLLVALMMIPKHHSLWRKLFSYKAWIFPALFFIILGFAKWGFNNKLNVQTKELLGFEWQWSTIATWAALFIIQLVIYQKRKIETVDSFVLASSSILLASEIYEFPFLFQQGFRLNSFLSTRFLLPIYCFVYLFSTYKWKFNRFYLLTFIPIILGWLFYFQLPYWIPRLTVFPLFLVLPFSFRKNSSNL